MSVSIDPMSLHKVRRALRILLFEISCQSLLRTYPTSTQADEVCDCDPITGKAINFRGGSAKLLHDAINQLLSGYGKSIPICTRVSPFLVILHPGPHTTSWAINHFLHLQNVFSPLGIVLAIDEDTLRRRNRMERSLIRVKRYIRW